MMKIFCRLLGNTRRASKDENGTAAVEYALIAGLISLAVVAGGAVAGQNIGKTMNYLGCELNPSNTQSGGPGCTWGS